MDFDHGVRSCSHSPDSLVDSPLFVLRSESYLAVTLQRHDEHFVQLLLYVTHVLRGGIPDIAQHVAELDAVLRASSQHPTIKLVLGPGALPSPLLLLLIEDPLALFDQLEGDRQARASLRGLLDVLDLEGACL